MLKVTLRGFGSSEVQAKSEAQLLKEGTQVNGKMRQVALPEKDSRDLGAYMRTFKAERADSPALTLVLPFSVSSNQDSALCGFRGEGQTLQ